MKNLTKLFLAVGTIALLACPSMASARSHYGFSINVGGPAFVAPPPVFPAPVMVAPPPPVVYPAPAPVFVAPVCAPRPAFGFSYVGF